MLRSPPRFCLAPLDTSLWRSSAPKTIHRIVFSVQNDAAGRTILKIKYPDKSQFIIKNNSYFFTLENLDIDKIIPISNIWSIRDVPPELKNGRDIPVLGMVLVTTAMFIAT